MIRLHVIAEGQTEKAFVDRVLSLHLAYFGVFSDARCVLTSRDKRAATVHRGGLTHYEKAKRDIMAWLKEDKDPACRFTTMFDLYGLPEDFPRFPEGLREHDPYRRIRFLEEALAQDIGDRRFIPYLQLHEFEALILADPKHLDWEYMEHEEQIQRLVQMVEDQNPELIDDGYNTSPSKRILLEIPAYDKVTGGLSVVEKIGLPVLRNRCAHFNEWLSLLEKLGGTR
jgi:hypothetical protein